MSVARFVADQRTKYRVPHAVVCALLGVSLAWFYKWVARTPTPSEHRRVKVDAAVVAAFTKARGLHGSPRLLHDLREVGWTISVKTVAESMRQVMRPSLSNPICVAGSFWVPNAPGYCVRRAVPGNGGSVWEPAIRRCRCLPIAGPVHRMQDHPGAASGGIGRPAGRRGHGESPRRTGRKSSRGWATARSRLGWAGR